MSKPIQSSIYKKRQLKLRQTIQHGIDDIHLQPKTTTSSPELRSIQQHKTQIAFLKAKRHVRIATLQHQQLALFLKETHSFIRFITMELD